MLIRRTVSTRSQDGFSLVELALGMFILAIVLGALLRPLANQIEQQKYRQTEQDLEQIREALYGYAMANGRLPRPAVSELDGSEAAQCAGDNTKEKTSVGISGSSESAANGFAKACSGFVPFATLGVARSDAYGKLYMYSVSGRFTVADPPLTFGDAGVWRIQTRAGADPTKLVNLAENVVAVVRSFGARNFGRSIQGSDIANDMHGNGDETFNSGTQPGNSALEALTFRYRLPSTQANPAWGGVFDDQMVWIPTSLYVRRMVEAGKLP